MNEQISSAATQAREQSRQKNGEFGAQLLDESDVDLVAHTNAQVDDIDSLWTDADLEAVSSETDLTAAADAFLAAAEADVATESPDVIDEIDLDNPAKPSTVDWDDPDQINNILKTSRQVARKWGTRRGALDNGMDVDDIAQEAILAVMTLRAKGKDAGINDVYGYVNRAAANVASRAGRRVRAEDMQAYSIYRDRLAELNKIAGRELTTPEKDLVAQQIRDNWPEDKKNHRPSPDFRNNVQGWEKVRSAAVTDDIFDMTVSMSGTAQSDNYVEPGSHLDVALAHLDEGSAGTKRTAKKVLWNALAENAPGSPVIIPHLGHRAVANANRRIGDEATFEATLDAWEDGVDNDATQALMSPWGDMDIRDQASAVELLRSRPAYAYDVWKTAVTAAARPRNTSDGDVEDEQVSA